MLWLLEAATQLAHDGLCPTQEVVAEAMAQSHGVLAEQVLAWMQSCELLARLASAAFDPQHDAYDEERAAVHQALRAGRPVLQWRVQHRLDLADASTLHPLCPHCQTPLQSQGRRPRGWHSLPGALALFRRYLTCPNHCGGLAPAERIAGLPAGEFTAFLEDRCTLSATSLPYKQAVAELAQLLGLDLAEATLKTMVERRAEAVQKHLKQEADNLNPYDPNGLPRPAPTAPQPAAPEPAVPVPDVGYVEVDGVLPMTRERLDDPLDEKGEPKKETARGGKNRRYKLVGREVKNAVLYDGAHCGPENDSRGCITEKRYVSHLGHWGLFALLLWVQMIRMRFDGARLVVVLSDGAEWIRSLAAWLPLSVLMILDLFHVKHRIKEVADAVFGDKTPETNTWAHEQNEAIEQGQAAAVLEAIAALPPQKASTQELVEALSTYLNNNLDRIDYPRYRAMGLRVSTAAVESGNYHVTGARLKGQGMRWEEQGASHMATLRADRVNGDWELRSRQILKAAA